MSGYGKTVISHGSSFPGIRLGVRKDTTKVGTTEVELTPSEAAELANRLNIALFHMGYDITARKRK